MKWYMKVFKMFQSEAKDEQWRENGKIDRSLKRSGMGFYASMPEQYGAVVVTVTKLSSNSTLTGRLWGMVHSVSKIKP